MLQATLSVSNEGLHTASGMAACILLVTSAPKPGTIRFAIDRLSITASYLRNDHCTVTTLLLVP